MCLRKKSLLLDLVWQVVIFVSLARKGDFKWNIFCSVQIIFLYKKGHISKCYKPFSNKTEKSIDAIEGVKSFKKTIGYILKKFIWLYWKGCIEKVVLKWLFWKGCFEKDVLKRMFWKGCFERGVLKGVFWVLKGVFWKGCFKRYNSVYIPVNLMMSLWCDTDLCVGVSMFIYLWIWWGVSDMKQTYL